MPMQADDDLFSLRRKADLHLLFCRCRRKALRPEERQDAQAEQKDCGDFFHYIISRQLKKGEDLSPIIYRKAGFL